MIGALRTVLLAVGLMWATGAGASTVAGAGVNCRAAAHVDSKVVGRLRRGEEVPVLSSRGAWSRVDPARLPVCWVRSDLLASGVPGTVARTGGIARTRAQSNWSSQVRGLGLHRASRRSYAAHPARSTARRGRSQELFGGGGNCPCSGGNICIGPRGGRYCITSGGNKRYGV